MKNSKINVARLGYIACLPIMVLCLCLCKNPNAGQGGDEPTEPAPTEVTKAPKAKPEEAAKPAREVTEPLNAAELDVKPTFEGKNAEDFLKWAQKHINYPEVAKEKGEEGRVVLSFVVTPQGKIENVKVLKGVSETLDAEAVRVVQSSPDWTPGKVNGKAVPVTYTFPIVFALR